LWHSAVAAAGAESKGAAVTAPGSAPDAAPSRSNEKCRLEEDGASPTWQAIGRQYSKLARAMQRKDLDALFALYAPSFEVRLPKEELATSTTGPVWNREQSLATQRARLAAVKESRLVSNTITRLLDCGDRVTATVLQQWYRTQMVGNVPRNIETAAVQDEEWIKTAGGWKRGNINNVRPGAWVVDGKRIDPSKGYDPDAPPYEPYPETSGNGP
jgi:ketosteroid isomerase-like protein